MPKQPGARRLGALRKDVVLFAAIVLFAFGLRLTYVLQLRTSPLFDHPEMDELYHDQWGQAIATGETYIDGPYFRAPLYPAFLGGVYKVFGHGYLAPRVIQGIIGSLSCGLLFLIGRIAFGRAIGAVAGFTAAGYWMLIYFDGELLIPPLIVFLDLLLIWLLLRATRKPGRLTYALAGGVLGLSALARPNILFFGPAVVVWIVVMHRREFKRALAYVACVTGACLLVIFPVTVRNYVVGGDLVLIASQGGVNFYIGNNPESDGRTAIVPGTPGGWWEGYHASVERATQSVGRQLKPSEVSQYYFGEAWDFIRQYPRKFLALTYEKLRLFWIRYETANNKDIYFWTDRFTPIVRVLPLGFGVVAPLGILGFAMCWRRRGELFPLWGFLVAYMASVVMFFCASRYRTPVLGVLILLAVYAVFGAVSAVREMRWKHILGGLAVLGLAASFVNVTKATDWVDYDAQSYTTLGIAYSLEGKPELAIESYRNALKVEPRHLMAQFKLAMLLHKARRLPEAIEHWRSAIAIRPELGANETMELIALAHYYLASALVGTSAYTEALEHYRESINLDPDAAKGQAQYQLGAVLARLGRVDEAAEAYRQAVEPFRRALANQPDDAVLLMGLGWSLWKQGRYDEALSPLRRCLSIQPTNALALEAFTDSLMQVALYEEAVDVLRSVASRGKPRLLSRLALLLATVPDPSLRNGQAALEYARQACPEPETCNARYLDALAAALAETGRFDQAAELARRALQRARRSQRRSDRDLIKPISERLDSYESGLPYRQPQ